MNLRLQSLSDSGLSEVFSNKTNLLAVLLFKPCNFSNEYIANVIILKRTVLLKYLKI